MNLQYITIFFTIFLYSNLVKADPNVITDLDFVKERFTEALTRKDITVHKLGIELGEDIIVSIDYLDNPIYDFAYQLVNKKRPIIDEYRLEVDFTLEETSMVLSCDATIGFGGPKFQKTGEKTYEYLASIKDCELAAKESLEDSQSFYGTLTFVGWETSKPYRKVL